MSLSKHRLGIAGLLIVLGCVGLRLRPAGAFGVVIWALSLMMIELGAILYLEGKASKIAAATREWEARRKVEDGKLRLRDAAKAELDRQVAIRTGLQQLIDEHIRDIADRQPRFASREETVAAFIKLKLNAYHAALARNRGFLLGTVRRPR